MAFSSRRSGTSLGPRRRSVTDEDGIFTLMVGLRGDAGNIELNTVCGSGGMAANVIARAANVV